MEKKSILRFVMLLRLAMVASIGGGLRAAEDPGRVDFRADVWPILVGKCHSCHGVEEQEARLRLDVKARVFKGGESGKVISPGASGESLLWRRITSDIEDERMPPEGKPLSKKEIGVIRKWIDQGAKWPDGIGHPEATKKKHWAYVRPVRPKLPEVRRTNWAINPLDRFILSKMERNGMSPSPEVDKVRWLRRVSLDLIGLPPSVEQIEAFAKDHSPAAYEKVVNRLLASPRYGERWSRPWLDLARYADSNGFQADQFRSIWPYRDWVINAMNADLPFDRFTIEQLAGDLLPNATVQQKVATGFHRCTTCNVEAGVDPEENRVNQILDRVNTTGTVWLGTTLECGQCHDHKYDPFTQQDYYQIFAYFNNTPSEVKLTSGVTFDFYGPKLSLPSSMRQSKQKAELQRRLTTLLEKKLTGEGNKKKTNQQIAKIKQQIKIIDSPTSLVMVENAAPRVTSILKRGDFQNLGKRVNPATPTSLHSMCKGLPANRLGFARWLVDVNNPLTARVTINRWWQEIFGQGIVISSEDFGTQSDLPTHPNLLDWLAVEFMESGWSMKHVHRLIVLSATYRQSARIIPAALARDPLNRLYARGPRLRLSAETIRDNGLAISGLLCENMGGPPIYPPQPSGVWRHVGRNAPKYITSNGEDRFRRGIYVVWRRSTPYPSFVNFDAPDRASCVSKRPRTNTPLQALTLLNDEAYMEMARGFAQAIVINGPNRAVKSRLKYAFRRCLSREADEQEITILTELFEQERTRFKTNPQAVASLCAGEKPGLGETDEEMAAWIVIASVLLNLDETISK